MPTTSVCGDGRWFKSEARNHLQANSGSGAFRLRFRPKGLGRGRPSREIPWPQVLPLCVSGLGPDAKAPQERALTVRISLDGQIRPRVLSRPAPGADVCGPARPVERNRAPTLLCPALAHAVAEEYILYAGPRVRPAAREAHQGTSPDRWPHSSRAQPEITSHRATASSRGSSLTISSRFSTPWTGTRP
jgi:hypothetical protein